MIFAEAQMEMIFYCLNTSFYIIKIKYDMYHNHRTIIIICGHWSTHHQPASQATADLCGPTLPGPDRRRATLR